MSTCVLAILRARYKLLILLLIAMTPIAGLFTGPIVLQITNVMVQDLLLVMTLVETATIVAMRCKVRTEMPRVAILPSVPLDLLSLPFVDNVLALIQSWNCSETRQLRLQYATLSATNDIHGLVF